MYFNFNRMIVCWNTDFYSSHVIPLNETISNYFVNLLLPSLFAKKKPQKLRIFTYPLSFNYFYDSKHVSDMVTLKLPEREFKSMLNFVRERIKHVYSVQL